MYEAILAPAQMSMASGSAAEAFNSTPPQWLREITGAAVSGTLSPPPGYEDDAYFWIGPSDGRGTTYGEEFYQIVGYAAEGGYPWHVFTSNVRKGEGLYTLCDGYPYSLNDAKRGTNGLPLYVYKN